MKPIWTMVAGAMLLSACGSEPRENGPMRQIVDQLITARKAAGAEPPPPPAPPTREQFAGVDREVALISVPNLGLKTLFTNVQDSGTVKTYFSGQKQALSFDNGTLIATRGFGWDLVVKDDSDPVKKSYKFYTSENGLSQYNVSCEATETQTEIEIVEVTYQTTLTESICRGPAVAFKNRIWRDAEGKTWRAEQWIGPQLGHAVVEFIN